MISSSVKVFFVILNLQILSRFKLMNIEHCVIGVASIKEQALTVCEDRWEMYYNCFNLLVCGLIQICCIEPLCVSRTTVDNSSSHAVGGGLLFAMASMSKMLIVALRPSLRVHYTRSLTGSPNTLPLFAWQFVSIRNSETERSTDPVLLFARDQYACFLQVWCFHSLLQYTVCGEKRPP